MSALSRLADPSICPDCRAALDPAATCTGCGLRLAGPAGRAPVAGDARRRPPGRGDPGGDAGAAAPVDTPTGAPRGARPGRATGAASRPRDAATAGRSPSRWSCCPSGALCLLVAAVVFVAIAWGSLGLTGPDAGPARRDRSVRRGRRDRGQPARAPRCRRVAAGRSSPGCSPSTCWRPGRRAGRASTRSAGARCRCCSAATLFALRRRRRALGPPYAGRHAGRPAGGRRARSPRRGGRRRLGSRPGRRSVRRSRFRSWWRWHCSAPAPARPRSRVVLLGLAAFSWLRAGRRSACSARARSSTWGAWWTRPARVAPAGRRRRTPRWRPCRRACRTAARSRARRERRSRRWSCWPTRRALPGTLTIETPCAPRAPWSPLAAVARLAAAGLGSRRRRARTPRRGRAGSAGRVGAVDLARTPSPRRRARRYAFRRSRLPPRAWTWPVVGARRGADAARPGAARPGRSCAPTLPAPGRRREPSAAIGLAVLVALVAARPRCGWRPPPALAAAAAPSPASPGGAALVVVAGGHRRRRAPRPATSCSSDSRPLFPRAVLTATASSAWPSCWPSASSRASVAARSSAPALTGGAGRARHAPTPSRPGAPPSTSHRPRWRCVVAVVRRRWCCWPPRQLTRRTSSRLDARADGRRAGCRWPPCSHRRSPSLAMVLTVVGTALAGVAVLNRDRPSGELARSRRCSAARR